jgi:branched-chain amino acid transport system substrate-binding protein
MPGTARSIVFFVRMGVSMGVSVGVSMWASGSAIGVAHADITVGVTLSATGPAASLGQPEKNTFALLPTTIAGEKVTYVVLDDGSDPSRATSNAQKLVLDSKADIIVGSSTVPTSLAAAAKAAEAKVAIITMAPIVPPTEIAPWVFLTPQSTSLMATEVMKQLKAAKVKTVGFIGYADPYGDDWLKNLTQLAEAEKIKLVATERFNRADTSVMGQALKVIAAKPDAVFIAASGTPSVLPEATLIERGFRGKIYQSHGSANRDFLRVGAKNVEGTVLPVGPILVAEQLPDDHPSKKVALTYVKLYEGAHGAGSRSTFGGHAYDAFLLVQRAAEEAIKKAKPGTPEFRKALRDALEGTKDLVGTHGVFTMSSTNHNGLDQRAVVTVKVEGGSWKLVK